MGITPVEVGRTDTISQLCSAPHSYGHPHNGHMVTVMPQTLLQILLPLIFKSHSKEVLGLSLAMIELGFNPRAIGGDEPVSERWDSGDSCEYQGGWMEVRDPNKIHLYVCMGASVCACMHMCACVYECGKSRKHFPKRLQWCSLWTVEQRVIPFCSLYLSLVLPKAQFTLILFLKAVFICLGIK